MSIRVLLADDHTVVRDGLEMMLDSEDSISVIGTATNGFEAIDNSKKLEPDVVLMDIAMPNMNGIEATYRIKEQNPDTKVLILSMKYNKESVFRALKAGAIGYILKESASDEVVEAVKAASENKRFLSEKVDEIVIDSYLNEKEGPEEEDPLELLSSREREVLQLVSEGQTNQQIANQLYISEKTVGTYRSRLMNKLELDNITELVKFAIKHNITDV